MSSKYISSSNISVLKEKIYQVYFRTFDLDLAYVANSIDEELRKFLEEDPGFQERLRCASVEAKAKLIDELKLMFDSEVVPSASTRLKALELYGKIIYPERFDENHRAKNQEEISTVNVYLPSNGRDDDAKA